ncbi:MAG: peptide transporter [Methanobacterium sp.]|uniref:STT3 domain-containing protein n=1 Tax=Methanobacterium sp. TaxID=2164 RepID=UPI003D653109|nr:peptide transporter [Methanobacterium sp.]
MPQNNHLNKRSALTSVAIILIIFSVGFILRVDSVNLPGIPDDQKDYYQDQNGLPYMYELDSYYNYRLTKNYIEHGYLGDTIKNGREWDLHSYYPPGVPMDYPPFIVYLTAFIYKLINIFANIPLLTVCFWIPLFIGPLAGLIAYLFVSRFTNDYGAAAAGIITVTAPFYFIRTLPGWFDTDMFNIIFPLLITWFFIESLQSKNNKMQIFFAALSAFSMFLFATAWNGWQYFFYLIVLFSIFYTIWCKIKGHDVKILVYSLGTLIIITILLVIVFTGLLNIIKLLLGPLEFIKLYGAQSQLYPWPNVYSSVSELAIPTIEEVISGAGFALFGGIFGLLWIFRILINKDLKKRFLNKMDWFFYSFLVLWTIAGILSLLKGSRFIMLLLPPLIISSGIMVGICVEYVGMLKNIKRFKIFKNENTIRVISLSILILVTLPAIINIQKDTSITPSANDNLWNASEWINGNIPQDTVIISQWSYGHFFTAIADHPVVFDGRIGYIETLPIRSYDPVFTFGSRSPNTSREYWIDNAFSTSNESLSVGIFRMLATSGDLAWLTLDEYTQNTTQSIEILNNILGVDKKTARDVLKTKYHLNETQINKTLNYTHPDNPRPFILVTTNGMANIGHLIFNSGTLQSKNVDYLYSIGDIKIDNNYLNSSDGISMDIIKNETTFNGEIPYCVITIEQGKVKKIHMNKNSDICVILLMDKKKSIVMNKQFENSLFTRTVLEKSNSTYFKSIYENNYVTVWKPI